MIFPIIANKPPAVTQSQLVNELKFILSTKKPDLKIKPEKLLMRTFLRAPFLLTKLWLVEIGIKALSLDELIVLALLNNIAILHNQDQVGIFNRG